MEKLSETGRVCVGVPACQETLQDYTAAQYAQVVGAIYYDCLRLKD